MPDDVVPVRRALLSVSDKAGLVEFGRFLVAQGAEILSTGGTARALREAGVPVREVGDHTGFPEILDGRVKTLVPQIHGGLLGRRDLQAHRAQMEEHGIAPIDLVVVDLYPFEATVAGGAGFDDCIENIDIGGPAMIRSAAKNHAHVAVLTEPAQLDVARAEIEARGGTTLALRRRLAAAAYARTAAYDAAISGWFAAQQGEEFPPRLAFAGALKQTLRYGENPHQRAAFYTDGTARAGIATMRQAQGKELSYNNLNDTDAAIEAVAEFEAPAIVIVKHANPCGVAVADSLAAAWDLAFRCDPVSPFGGIVAANRTLDAAAAERIAAIFTEVVVAPDADEGARAVFASKKNLRLLLTGGLPDPAAPGLAFRSVAGGFLAQSRDSGRVTAADLRVVTRRAPTATEMADLLFAFRVCKHVKSNAIVYAKGGATVGIGAGQMSRVDSARIAAWKSEEAARAAGLAEPLARG
ncbi:MAG: IMP cyclohydrolase / Phosphoribosylaminoimidazolecarboxamide formyltransferase, partial [uncultured Acetobacteraceae bacterium]